MFVFCFLYCLFDVFLVVWDVLYDGWNLFVFYVFLYGLEVYGCLCLEWGWCLCYFILWEGDFLVVVIFGYFKDNLYGEFVFDYVWVYVYVQYGCDYFFKWFGVVLYLLVIGLCLLVYDDVYCVVLLVVLIVEVGCRGWFLVYFNFYFDVENVVFGVDWMCCEDIQFQWYNFGYWYCFEEFFVVMDYKYCKNICQECVRLVCCGVMYWIVYGDEVSEDDLQVMYGFYLQIFVEYGNFLVLMLLFLCYLVWMMLCYLVIFLVLYDGMFIVGVLCLCGVDMLYGCYWGGVILFGLYFEICYYQGIEYCLCEGVVWFEFGVQGEYKFVCGFLFWCVYSYYWIVELVFVVVLVDWCVYECVEVDCYVCMLVVYSLFKVLDV